MRPWKFWKTSGTKAGSVADAYFANGYLVVKGRLCQMVRNSEDPLTALRFAAQGPVISEDPECSRAVAVSATWLDPGANGLLANIGINLTTGRPFVRPSVHTPAQRTTPMQTGREILASTRLVDFHREPSTMTE